MAISPELSSWNLPYFGIHHLDRDIARIAGLGQGGHNRFEHEIAIARQNAIAIGRQLRGCPLISQSWTWKRFAGESNPRSSGLLGPQ